MHVLNITTKKKIREGASYPLSLVTMLIVLRISSGVPMSQLILKTTVSFCGVVVVVVQSLGCVWLFETPLPAARQASLSFTVSWNWLKLKPIESVMPSNHLVLCRPLLLCSVFPESESFPMSWLFTSGGQSIGVSTSVSVIPMNIQSGFPLGWMDWISLLSKALSKVFSNTTVQRHQFFSAQSSLWSSSCIHTWPLEKP